METTYKAIPEHSGYRMGGMNATSHAVIDPPLKWHCSGGKHYLAQKIIALFPPHLHYVEPYFGGGAVLLAKDPEGVSEVVNDLNMELSRFWAALQDAEVFAEVHRRLTITPFSEVEWEVATLSRPDTGKLIVDAVNFFIRCRMSMSGRMKNFAPLSRTRIRRGMNEQVSAWMNCVDGLPAVHARLRRVVILNRDALDVIQQQDGPQTLYYLDPPYLHKTRATVGEYGAEEMTTDHHIELLMLLSKVKGKFLLSGYRSKLYNSEARRNGWNCHEFDIANHAASGALKRRMTECVWTNF
jgi:DNA adenine methylase